MPRRWWILVITGIALAGCRDITSADKPLTVALSVDPTPTQVITDTPNGPLITCTFGLTARATGSGRATWVGARTLWYIGPDRAAPVDTTLNAQAEVQDAFGAEGISAGQTQHTTWHLYAGAPFEASLGFSYATANGEPTFASTRITCGPLPQGAVVPQVTQLSVSNASGELKIGDEVSVSFQATSSSGVWLTVVNVSGAFLSQQIFGERLATNVNRTVKFVVPNGVHSGVPLTVSVRAFNAALVGTAKSVETQLAYADNTPPTLTLARTLERQQNPQANGLAGQYAVGDSLIVFASARDNDALGWLVWELGPPANVRDSLAGWPGQPVTEWALKLKVRPEWVGTPALKVYARDVNGLTSEVATSPTDSLRFYPVVTHPTSAALQLSAQSDADDMAYDVKRGLMYVGIPQENRIVVFSPTTMALQPPIILPGTPAAMDLSLSGDSLLVAVPSAKSIQVIDLTKPQATPATLKLSILDSINDGFGGAALAPGGVRIAANGKMIVVLINPTPNGDQVVEVDLTTGRQRIRTDTRGMSRVVTFLMRFMGRTDDRSRIYIFGGCVNRYDATSDTFSTCPSNVGGGLDGFTFDASGTYMTLGRSILDAEMHTTWTADPINQWNPNLAITSNDDRVYLGALQSLTTMRFADKVMLERMTIPMGVERLFPDPSGSWLLAFQRQSGAKVVRVDLR